MSTELGAFVAGVMLSVTDQQEIALHRLESIKSFFISLFISSTGLIMSPVFLMQHLPVLMLGVLVVILAKTVLVSVLHGSSDAKARFGSTMCMVQPVIASCASQSFGCG